MTLWLWMLVALLLLSASRSAVDIALDRVKQEPFRRVTAQALVLGVGSLLWLLVTPGLAPVGITGLLAAAATGGRAWLLRALPPSTLPPVKY